jgi:CDGSH-type Zn-finger protein
MSEERKTTKKTADSKAKIKVSKDGPYLVSGGIPLGEEIIVADQDGAAWKWKSGGQFKTGEKYALCRCGESSKMPFCDGSHQEVNFDGEETASREPYLDQAEQTDGPELTLTDAIDLCAGARFCDRAGGTWELVEHSDDPEAKRLAIQQVADCPSGRLVMWNKKGKPIEPDFKPSIGVVEDPPAGVSGPLWVRGGIPVESVDGETYEKRNRVTLCRCGRSKNKPFCDAAHTQG